MRLALSRAAAPAMDLAALDALAQKRGLDGLELAPADVPDAARAAAIWVEDASFVATEGAARASAKLGVPVVAARGAIPASKIADLESLYAREGGRLCLTHGTDAEEAAELTDAIARAGASHVGTAWEIRPADEKLDDAAAVLLAASETLAYVRLRGGGPELSSHEGAGLGPLFQKLALSHYAGTITLTPSAGDRVEAWERWLTRSGRCGCGSAPGEQDIDLDMRAVEPRERLDTILGAYHALAPGRTLHLTLDHDPSCMYYTLEATERAGSFEFQRIVDGPDHWRVDVRKR